MGAVPERHDSRDKEIFWKACCREDEHDLSVTRCLTTTQAGISLLYHVHAHRTESAAVMRPTRRQGVEAERCLRERRVVGLISSAVDATFIWYKSHATTAFRVLDGVIAIRCGNRKQSPEDLAVLDFS